MTATANLFIELFSEEIPARMQLKAAADMKSFLETELKALGLNFESATTHVTPRRLVAHITSLDLKQPDISEERKGPNVNAPEQAMQGFLRSTGLTREQCEERETPKGTFLFAKIEKAGVETKDLLPTLVTKMLDTFPWPKSMRWQSGSKSWVRPLHSGICLLGAETVNFDYRFGEHDNAPIVTFANITEGHRFLSPETFTVNSFEDYVEQLGTKNVIVDHTKRLEMIQDQATKLSSELGLEMVVDKGLLDEVCGLVEWPNLMIGKIDPKYMDLPEELLLTVMKVHQRYIALRDTSGKLAPHFIIACNTIPDDGGKAVVHGNERVLTARFADAQFYYDLDRKQALEKFNDGLKDIVFHEKLGTVAQRVARIQTITKILSPLMDANPDHALRAATLCKADLTTGMVYEFPELQGIMGQYYAANETGDVAQAIAEHYAPKGPSDPLPSSKSGQVVALADKLDALVGFFSMDIKPTGSKDPFALRRAALGIIRLVESSITEPLATVFTAAYTALTAQGIQPVKSVDETLADLNAFICDRLRVQWRDEGLNHDTIAALLSKSQHTSIQTLKKQAQDLQDFLNEASGKDLLSAYKRAANIVRIESKKSGETLNGTVDTNHLSVTEEKALAETLAKITDPVSQDLAAGNFKSALKHLSTLRSPLDSFFDQVTVNDNDPAVRKNRLNLLTQINKTFDQIADFSVIEG